MYANLVEDLFKKLLQSMKLQCVDLWLIACALKTDNAVCWSFKESKDNFSFLRVRLDFFSFSLSFLFFKTSVGAHETKVVENISFLNSVCGYVCSLVSGSADGRGKRINSNGQLLP